ncbi:hypothetical protein Tco_1497031, partial [Tanacetum coccineum]
MVAGCLDEHLNKNEVVGVSLGFLAYLATSSLLGPANQQWMVALTHAGTSFHRISE